MSDMSQENSSNDMMNDANAEVAPPPPGNGPGPSKNLKDITHFNWLDRSIFEYFENRSNEMYFVKPEKTGDFGSNRVEVRPGQVYVGPIDGFGNKRVGVVKVPDGTKVEIGRDGKANYITSPYFDILHTVLGLSPTKLTLDDLKKMNEGKDHGWDELFFETIK